MTRTRPYQPLHDFDVDVIWGRYCHCCKHRGSGGDMCPIFADAVALDPDEPGYPTEMIQRWDDRRGGWGQPECTAYADELEPDRTPRCPWTGDLFGGQS